MGKKSRPKKTRKTSNLPKRSRKNNSNIRYQPYKQASDNDDLLQSLYEFKHQLESGQADIYDVVAQLMNKAGIDLGLDPSDGSINHAHSLRAFIEESKTKYLTGLEKIADYQFYSPEKSLKDETAKAAGYSDEELQTRASVTDSDSYQKKVADLLGIVRFDDPEEFNLGAAPIIAGALEKCGVLSTIVKHIGNEKFKGLVSNELLVGKLFIDMFRDMNKNTRYLQLERHNYNNLYAASLFTDFEESSAQLYLNEYTGILGAKKLGQYKNPQSIYTDVINNLFKFHYLPGYHPEAVQLLPIPKNFIKFAHLNESMQVEDCEDLNSKLICFCDVWTGLPVFICRSRGNSNTTSDAIDLAVENLPLLRKVYPTVNTIAINDNYATRSLFEGCKKAGLQVFSYIDNRHKAVAIIDVFAPELVDVISEMPDEALALKESDDCKPVEDIDGFIHYGMVLKGRAIKEQLKTEKALHKQRTSLIEYFTRKPFKSRLEVENAIKAHESELKQVGINPKRIVYFNNGDDKIQVVFLIKEDSPESLAFRNSAYAFSIYNKLIDCKSPLLYHMCVETRQNEERWSKLKPFTAIVPDCAMRDEDIKAGLFLATDLMMAICTILDKHIKAKMNEFDEDDIKSAKVMSIARTLYKYINMFEFEEGLEVSFDRDDITLEIDPLSDFDSMSIKNTCDGFDVDICDLDAVHLLQNLGYEWERFIRGEVIRVCSYSKDEWIGCSMGIPSIRQPDYDDYQTASMQSEADRKAQIVHFTLED